MKTTITILIVLFVLSCNTNRKKADINTKTEDIITIESESKDAINENNISIEEIVYDKTASLETRLCQLYDIAESSASGEKLLAFTELLTQNLENGSLYNDSLNHLSQRIKVNRLGNLKFYSYDDMTGGSMRYINSYMQYLGEDNNVYYIELEDKGTINFAYEFTDHDKKMILLVSHLKCGNSCCTAYLRVFESIANTYLKTTELFPQKGDEIYEKYFNRDEGLNGSIKNGNFEIHKYIAGIITYNFENLEFNPQTNIVSYDEFLTNDEGIAVPTGKRIEFKLRKVQ